MLFALLTGTVGAQDPWLDRYDEAPRAGYYERPWARPDVQRQPWPEYDGPDWTFRGEGGGMPGQQSVDDPVADPWPYFGVRPWGEYENPRYRREGRREPGRRLPDGDPWREGGVGEPSGEFRPLNPSGSESIWTEPAPYATPGPW